jgi:hypothetical protein
MRLIDVSASLAALSARIFCLIASPVTGQAAQLGRSKGLGGIGSERKGS